MNILLTNDDGIHSRSLWTLYHSLSACHSVTVIAPDRERSAVGHGITLREPLRVNRVRLNDGESGISVSGTPADCVKIGVLELLKEKPDMVISGINAGANVGIDIHYSGTVAAAKEAAFHGILSVAVSMVRRDENYFAPQTDFLISFLERIQKYRIPIGTFLNVNFPNVPKDLIKGVKITPHSMTFSKEYFEKRVDPKNEEYYWHVMYCDIHNGSSGDKRALHEGYITITPVKCDLTDYDFLENLLSLEMEIG